VMMFAVFDPTLLILWINYVY